MRTLFRVDRKSTKVQIEIEGDDKYSQALDIWLCKPYISHFTEVSQHNLSMIEAEWYV